MSSTLICFDDKSYEYQYGEIEEQGIGTSGYILVFLADLVASYLLGEFKPNFHPTTYHGSVMIFKKRRVQEKLNTG